MNMMLAGFILCDYIEIRKGGTLVPQKELNRLETEE